MKLTDYIGPEHIKLDLEGSDKQEIIEELVEHNLPAVEPVRQIGSQHRGMAVDAAGEGVAKVRLISLGHGPHKAMADVVGARMEKFIVAERKVPIVKADTRKASP